jgi:general secretion pathway protein G
MRISNARTSSGFSLVELLIVVAIILLLLTVALPAAKSARLNAAETVVMREMHTIHQAQMQYFSQFGSYADPLAQLGPRSARLIPASPTRSRKNSTRRAGVRSSLMKTALSGRTGAGTRLL